MLLPTVLPAVADLRADDVSRVYANIEIGGAGGDTSCHPRLKTHLDLVYLNFHDGRFFALVNWKLKTLQHHVMKINHEATRNPSESY